MNKTASSIMFCLILAFVSCAEKSKKAGVGDAQIAANESIPAQSPETAREARPSSGAEDPQQSKEVPGFFLIGFSSRHQSDATREMERLNRAGFQTRVTASDEWSGLDPGWYIVVYDAYGTAAEASAAAEELRSRKVNFYVKFAGHPKSAEATSALAKGDENQPEEKEEVSEPIDPRQEEGAVGKFGADGADAIKEVRKLWDQHFTRCGDSYLAVNAFQNLRQLKGVTFILSERSQLTATDKHNGVEWRGTVKVTWNLWRSATGQSSGWSWGDWRDSRQARSFAPIKRNSKWKVLDSLYDQKKIECSDVGL